MSRPKLPEGYKLVRDPDILTLYAPDGSVVARWIAGNVPNEEIEAEAWRHHRGEDFRELAFAVVIGLVYGVLLGWGSGITSPLW